MPSLIQFTVSPQDDPNGAETRALLAAHLAHERVKATRQFWVHLLAAVGGLVALGVLFPQAGSPEIRAALLALWGACCVCAVVAAVLEWKWRRREARLLAPHRAVGKWSNEH